ncbi:MAG: hypothetical protein HKN45_05905 [Flavobacteriales bacterium]|nr:hypothetical protein [Flavobacteriales bacterium]
MIEQGLFRITISIVCTLSLYLFSAGQTFEKLPLDPNGIDEDLILGYVHNAAEDSLSLITSSFLSYAQNEDPSRLAEAYYYRAMYTSFIFDYPETIVLTQMGLNQKETSVDLLDRIHKLSSTAHLFSGNLDSANYHLDVILEHEDSVDPEFLAEVYYARYQIQFTEGQDEKALENLYKSLELFEASGDYSFAATIRSYIGVIYHRMDRDSLAMVYQQEALDYFIENDELDNASYVYLERGNMLIDLGRYTNAIEDLQTGIDISQEIGHIGNVANGLNILGRALARNGDIKGGIEKNRQALALCRDYQIPIGIASCEVDLATLFLDIQEADSSLKYSIELYEISRREGFPDYEEDATDLLARTYAMKNDFDQAYKFRTKHLAIKDSIYSQETAEKMAELREVYEREKNLREVESLKNQAKIERLKRNGLLGGMGLLLLLSGIIVNRELQRRKKSRLLLEAELELKEARNEKLRQKIEFKNRELSSNALNMARKNEFLQTIDEKLKSISIEGEAAKSIHELKNDLRIEGQMENNWDQFMSQFKETDPSFYQKLNESYPDLSKGELRLSALIRMNLGNKEIARMLNISDEGVKKARYRLRKKLDLLQEDSLEAKLLSL